ncbi:MAG: hypothetical protein WEB37_07810 [Bacteroidota bacterium]
MHLFYSRQETHFRLSVPSWVGAGNRDPKCAEPVVASDDLGIWGAPNDLRRIFMEKIVLFPFNSLHNVRYTLGPATCTRSNGVSRRQAKYFRDLFRRSTVIESPDPVFNEIRDEALRATSKEFIIPKAVFKPNDLGKTLAHNQQAEGQDFYHDADRFFQK